MSPLPRVTFAHAAQSWVDADNVVSVLAVFPAADIAGFNKAYELSNYALAGTNAAVGIYHAFLQSGAGQYVLLRA
jgi:hypothetical protein